MSLSDHPAGLIHGCRVLYSLVDLIANNLITTAEQAAVKYIVEFMYLHCPVVSLLIYAIT